MNKLSSSKLKNFLIDIKDSIGGNEQDFTQGSLKRAIFLLSVPMVLEMISESFFAIADIVFVAKLGAGAIATVGITEAVMTLIYAIAVGLCAGVTALVSRRIGEHNNDGAAIASVQAIFTAVVFAVLFAIPGVIWAKDILRLMGATNEMVNNGYQYTSIMFGGNAVIMLLFIMNAIFRGAGDAAISFRVLFFANIINIILDPCLIFGLGPFPEMGIKGAAIATNIGRGSAVLYQFYVFFNQKHRIKAGLKHLKLQFNVLGNLIKLSLGGIGQYIISTSSWIILIRIVSEFGKDILAGYTVALRIVAFAILPSWGISNATSTLVGQNLGAKQPKRAEKSVLVTSISNMVLMGIVSIFLIVFSSFFIGLISDEQIVIINGTVGLEMISYGFIFYALGMVMANTLNGAGDTITPTIINFFCFWLLEIPLAYLLAFKTGLNEKGVYWSVVISESTMAIVGFIIFKRGKWKLREV